MTFPNQNDFVLSELKLISKILLLANSEQLDRELEKIAENESRKKMWVLIDGKRMPKEIAAQVGVSLMTVSRFLDSALAADLVFYAAKYPPAKKLNYVPSAWLNLVFGKAEEVDIQKKTAVETVEKQQQLFESSEPEKGAKK